MPAKYTSKFVARFWAKVQKSDDPDACWTWNAGTVHGYGSIYWNGHSLRAHRVAYELIHGSLPDELEVCHSCDNPPCVNPRHLFLGTHLDNVRDMNSKGRDNRSCQPHGEQHYKCKLTDEQVVEIRRLYAAGGATQLQLAAAFGVSRSTIQHILYRKTRQHVP